MRLMVPPWRLKFNTSKSIMMWMMLNKVKEQSDIFILSSPHFPQIIMKKLDCQYLYKINHWERNCGSVIRARFKHVECPVFFQNFKALGWCSTHRITWQKKKRSSSYWKSLSTSRFAFEGKTLRVRCRQWLSQPKLPTCIIFSLKCD